MFAFCFLQKPFGVSSGRGHLLHRPPASGSIWNKGKPGLSPLSLRRRQPRPLQLPQGRLLWSRTATRLASSGGDCPPARARPDSGPAHHRPSLSKFSPGDDAHWTLHRPTQPPLLWLPSGGDHHLAAVLRPPCRPSAGAHLPTPLRDDDQRVRLLWRGDAMEEF